MARTLKRTVVVGGVTYPAGTEETAKLAKAIPNAKAWDGASDPEPAAAPRKRAAAKAQKAPAEQTPEEPPRGGEGATEEAWRKYAVGLEIEVPEDAGRDDIIALVDASRA